MATPKIITADDIEQGKLTIIRRGSNLHIERRYVFVDGQGDAINNLAGGRVVEEIPLANIPANIISALQDIDNWTYGKGLVQEGMED